MATKSKATQGELIAQTIATYNSKRNERLKLDAESAKLKVEEDSLLDILTAAKVKTGVYGSYSVIVGTKTVPRCTDWHAFHAYLKETGNFDMLHKRLTETAIMARLDNGEYVPGIVKDDKTTYKFMIA